jgi:hypothetical protein
MAEMAVNKSETDSSGDNNVATQKKDPHILLMEATWTIAFIRDVALAHAMNADEQHVGITPDGEQGLGLILAKVEQDLQEAYDLF